MGLRDLLEGKVKGKRKGGSATSEQNKSESNNTGSVLNQVPASVDVSASNIKGVGLQEQIDAVSQGGVLALDVSQGEYEGPVVLSRAITIDGRGRSIWSKKGPVVSVEADGVILSNLEIEVTGNENRLSEEEACALAIKPGVQIVLKDIVVRGNVMGVAEEVGIWRYPRSLRIGGVKANQAHDFTLRLAVPIPCQFKSEIAGLNINPENIDKTGIVDFTIKVDPLSPGTRLRGSILIETAYITRRIIIGGSVASTPGQNEIEGKGQVLWEPEDAASIPVSQAGLPIVPEKPSSVTDQQSAPVSSSQLPKPIVNEASPEPAEQSAPTTKTGSAPQSSKQQSTTSKKIPVHPPDTPHTKKPPVVPDASNSAFKQAPSAQQTSDLNPSTAATISSRKSGVPMGGVFGASPDKLTVETPAAAKSADKAARPPDTEMKQTSSKAKPGQGQKEHKSVETDSEKLAGKKTTEKKPQPKKSSKVKTDGIGGAWDS
jgi:hypothetical protein